MLDRETEVDLARRARKGDREAFGMLYQSSWRPVLAFVSSQVRDPDEARSIAQESFLDAWRGIRDLDDPARFPGWIRTIATHRVIKWRERTRAPVPISSISPDAGEGRGVPDPAAPSAENPAAKAERREAVSAALRALEDFPAAHREAILLRLLEGLKFREIAERLGLGVDQVKGIVGRGVVRLAAGMKAWMGETT